MKTKINYISNPPALPYHKSKTVNENVKKISTTISTQSCTGNKSDFIGPGLGWQQLVSSTASFNGTNIFSVYILYIFAAYDAFESGNEVASILCF